MSKIYDLIIVGAGPAGLSAALYAGRSKLSTLVLEKSKTGGQIVITHEVANYHGSVREATGPSLIARMVEQVTEFGAEIKADDVIDVDFSGDIKIVKGEKEEYKAKSVIIATGDTPRKMGCPGEAEQPRHPLRGSLGSDLPSRDPARGRSRMAIRSGGLGNGFRQ